MEEKRDRQSESKKRELLNDDVANHSKFKNIMANMAIKKKRKNETTL